MSTTQSFSYLKEQPTTLLLQNGYCNTAGGAASVWRISTTPGSTVASCNDLCVADSRCKRFLFGKEGASKNRCDLISIDDCQMIAGHKNFEYYQPTQNNLVRQRASHKSIDQNGCNSMSHPANYLGKRNFGTQAECTNACW